MRYSYTGLQNQCAAAFGGVNRWHWTYGEMSGKFRRESLLNELPTAQILNVAIDVQGLKVEQITPQN